MICVITYNVAAIIIFTDFIEENLGILIFALVTSPLWIILIMKLFAALKNKTKSGENKVSK